MFTDPDFAGKKIRDTLKRYIPNIKHAFISQKDATRNDNIGVENANDEAILDALKNVAGDLKLEEQGDNYILSYSGNDNNIIKALNGFDRNLYIFNIKEINLIIGKNNTGKTYLSNLLYTYFKVRERQNIKIIGIRFKDILSDLDYETIKDYFEKKYESEIKNT